MDVGRRDVESPWLFSVTPGFHVLVSNQTLEAVARVQHTSEQSIGQIFFHTFHLSHCHVSTAAFNA